MTRAPAGLRSAHAGPATAPPHPGPWRVFRPRQPRSSHDDHLFAPPVFRPAAAGSGASPGRLGPSYRRAWWPRSYDLTAELPGLLAGLPHHAPLGTHPAVSS
ncbi:DUF5994 family protein [Streptomyces sp. NPDC102462]|uniref:DUF5994 family protein n=1 Tax=Streptomyces sp. NPDC102462 TaxID=3366178 RepID=UPI003811B02E